MRRGTVSVLFTVILLLAAGCSQGSKTPTFASGSGKVNVVASFYPVFEFARAVGGDKADVVSLIPAGVEPHDWEPSPKDMKMLNAAGLFVYNGAGLEHWVPKTLASLDNKRLVAVETAKGLDLMNGGPEEKGEAEALDPHVWLDPAYAIRQVEAIRDGFIQVDAANKDVYTQNAGAYIKQLTALDQEYQTGLTRCPRKDFFTAHAAFGYLARQYGVTQHPIMGLSPDAEPTPLAMAKVAASAKELGIKYIFFETLVSDKLARTLAQEVGAKALPLNPIEGLADSEVKAGKSYLSVMRENLGNLRLALECGK
ncbi:MAG TPA: metal ABC transporter substrate-binding protein [Symbiobacteriaceae bacterium]|jgi:zinc transport system substrate-binding protein